MKYKATIAEALVAGGKVEYGGKVRLRRVIWVSWWE